MTSKSPKGVAAPSTRIDRIISPLGIEAWLVEDYTVPIVSMDFAFVGGGSQDPVDQHGLSNLLADLLSEGAGDLDTQAFQEMLEEYAIEIDFNSNKDRIDGSLRTLRQNTDLAFDLLAKTINAPRFDDAAVERSKSQILAGLKQQETDPDSLVWRTFLRKAYGEHPYGSAAHGSLASVPGLARADLVSAHRTRFARSALKIAVVGAISASELGKALDRVFGALPATFTHGEIADVEMAGIGERAIATLAVPQSTLVLGRSGFARRDARFIPAYIVNHILGGGSFTSRLWNEVREKRGLAYSVWSQLSTSRHTSAFFAGTTTGNEKAAEATAIIEAEVARMAEKGPKPGEFDKAMKYLIGSYALRFDTSRKIANHLVEIQVEDLGIDYIANRNQRFAAVALKDTREAAAQLLGDAKLLVVAAGQPAGISSS